MVRLMYSNVNNNKRSTMFWKCVCVLWRKRGVGGGPLGFQNMYEPPLNLGT